MSIYQFKPHFQKLLFPLLGKLRSWGLSPNDLTLLGMGLSAAGGVFILLFPAHIWVLGIVLTLRMAVNALDGMMARVYQLQSNTGAILNEIGDILSDLFLYAPLFFILGLSPVLLTCLCMAILLTEFAGVLAQAVYGQRAYQGPMGKSDRAFWISLIGMVIMIFPKGVKYLEILGWVLLLSMVITVINRLKSNHKPFKSQALLLLLIFILFSPAIGFTQIDALKTISLEIELIVNDQTRAKEKLEDFFREFHVVPELLHESNNQLKSQFTLSDKGYYDFVERVENWGIIPSRKIESINYSKKLEQVHKEIQTLEAESTEYTQLLKQFDITSENHVKYWEKLIEVKDQLRDKIEVKEKYLGSNKKFRVDLIMKEENLISHELDFSFVNMPGIQYSYFLPTKGGGEIYPKSMNGYSIKYLMNRRKTYVELGLFKSDKPIELIKFDELYKVGVGQDFYSAHLGRGLRKSMNLYSGFQFGLMILTGDKESLVSWYGIPSIGIELYKTKNILLDTKAGYFLPFKENRNMRGLLFEASLNILF